MKIGALFLVVFAFSVVSLAQSPKTVTDYFLAFPTTDYVTNAEGKEFTTKAEIEKFRRSLIKIEDIKNGYLRLEGGWEGWGEFALFKKGDGGYLIARTMVECGPVCTGTLAFYEYKDGKWDDVTGPFFQAPDNDEVIEAATKAKLKDKTPNMYYALPRTGTQITMKCSMCKGDADMTLFTYRWKAPKFHPKLVRAAESVIFNTAIDRRIFAFRPDKIQ